MTSLFETVVGDSFTAISKDANHNIQHRQYRHVLKSKENIYNNRCKRNLKRKLKKYKLRQDGKEDQDIIDVSHTLISKLLIRSPNKAKDSVELEVEQYRPKNYLFRMARRKQATLKTSKISQSCEDKSKAFEENDTKPVPSPSEEKKHTNAFKLLMESRNKSLGTNSPGKDKPKDDIEQNEISEKKDIKAKRNLMLQKMAEDKGSIKKKEIEEQHEKYIKKKMEKRAEKLKSMILHKEPKPVTDEENKTASQKTRSPLDSIDTETNGKVVDKPVNTLQLVSMFNETVEEKTCPKKKLITKEDKEFLKKLSPSIRKKESMLSYFKKIEKDSENGDGDVDAENDSAVIKVKLGSKVKKRGRKKKLSLKRDTEECDDDEKIDVDLDANDTLEVKEEIEVKNKASEASTERKKRKRENKESTPSKDCLSVTDTPDDKRPKRTVKRPVKYSDDMILTSSDEELHIFTPKKKKHIENKKLSKTDIITIKDVTEKSKPDKKLDSNEKNSKKEKKESKNLIPSKPVKLAPIFSKPQPDAAAIEAKQKFLQSGVPEQLKKLMTKQKNCSTLSNSFPVVVHVQQIESTGISPLPAVNLSKEHCLENFDLDDSKDVFTKMLNLEPSQSASSMLSNNTLNAQTVLQNLKESYPRFPVYRIYKLLRGKKKGEYKDSNIFSNLDNSVEILNCSIDMQNDNPDQLTWSDKYKPLSGNEIIGNFESIRELKKWLITWTENVSKSKVTSIDSDSSDYYQSDPDSRDSMKSFNNLLILSGPVGSGKTSCVYAVAAELSMKVIEVNASSKRTGKIMLQDLQEATQSHKVNRGTGSSENSQKTQEIIEPPPENKVKKRGRPKKAIEIVETPKKVYKEKLDGINGLSASQDSTRTAMSLILIDDADIVFDQDDGFCSAIMQLIQCSKRPVILATGSLTLPHLQKFLQSSKILRMKPLLPNMLGTWLDLMCLADSGHCWPGLGAKFLNFFKGDMRRTINCLQFYVGSQEPASSVENPQIDSQGSDVRINVDDENSGISWAEREIVDDKNTIDTCSTDSQLIWGTFLKDHTHLKQMKSPLKMFDVWWNVPKILNTHNEDIQKPKTSAISLECVSDVLDSISICDFLSQKRPEIEENITSHPWYDAECDSVSELENLDNYDNKYNTTKKLCWYFITGSITSAQRTMGLEHKYELDFPGMSVKRQRDRVVTRHTELTSYLSPQSSLDRRALALDYWASCRAICRTEKSKTDSNFKRNNRFCHYLKSLSVQCKSESFDKLANSLNPTETS